MESIRMGSKGTEVKRLQELLRQHGFKEIDIDGIFGTKEIADVTCILHVLFEKVTMYVDINVG